MLNITKVLTILTKYVFYCTYCTQTCYVTPTLLNINKGSFGDIWSVRYDANDNIMTQNILMAARYYKGWV